MSEWINWPPTWATVLLLPALLVGFTVHELAHALVAYLLGDTSQVERRRLTFNPLRHVSWIGLIVFLLFGFGWAKPVWVDHTRLRLRNRAFGTFLVSIAGAMANLLVALAVLVGMSMTVYVAWVYTDAPASEVMAFLMAASPGPDAHGMAIALSYYMLVVNLLLAFFNLIPLPPLDGFHALVSLVAAVRSALRGGPTVARPEGQAVAPGAQPPDAEPQSPARIHFDIGLEYHRAGEWDEAIARYRQATEHDHDLALAYYNLGLAYWAKGRTSLAISSFRATTGARGDPAVLLLAEKQLQVLTRAERDPAVEVGPAPPPLAMAEAVAPVRLDPEPVDPEISRRLWIRLAAGGLLAAAIAVAAWAYVTMVTMMGLA
ncbi:MAG: tetratricopeptide repeat protein [Anaerolineae bacterium]|nr:tetratricopeptide repeat protein [Anaerolineae bacterium]